MQTREPRCNSLRGAVRSRRSRRGAGRESSRPACRSSSSMRRVRRSRSSRRHARTRTMAATGTASMPASGCMRRRRRLRAPAMPRCSSEFDASPTTSSACRTPTATSGTTRPSAASCASSRRSRRAGTARRHLRTWDIWTHSYLILGLLEAHRHFANATLSGSSVPDRRSVLAHADERRHRHHRPRQSSRHVGDGADGPGARAALRDGRATLSSISRCASWSRRSAIRGWRC